MYDKIGPISASEIGLSAAYHFYIGGVNKTKIYFNEFNEITYRRLTVGLSFAVSQFGLAGDELKLNDLVDNAISQQGEKKIHPNAAIGLFYRSPKTQIGLSIPQIMHYRVSFSDVSRADLTKLQHYYLFFMQTLYFNAQNLRLQPWSRFKYTINAPAQVEVGLRFGLRDIGWVGAAYRTKRQLLFEGGVHIKNKFLLGYAYDLPIVNYRNILGQSHEIMIGYSFTKSK